MKIIYFILLALMLTGCLDDREIKYNSSNEQLLELADDAAIFWQTRGYSVYYSDNPNTNIFLVPREELQFPILALCRAKSKYRIDLNLQNFPDAFPNLPEDFKGTIRCQNWIFNYQYQDSVFVMAHEFGHLLGFNHTSECPNIMSTTIVCRRVE